MRPHALPLPARWMLCAALAVVVLSTAAHAQESPAASAVPFSSTPAVPFAATPALTPVAPPADARAEACAAEATPGFSPYTVRAGDGLENLLAGHTAYTALDVAALNCLDGLELPVGARIRLPADVLVLSLAARVSAQPPAEPVTALQVPARTAIANTEPLAIAWQAPPNSIVAITWCPAASTDAVSSADAAAEVIAAAADACPPPAGPYIPQPPSGVLVAEGFQYAGPLRLRFDWGVMGSATEQGTVFADVMVSCAYPSLAPQPAARRCPDAPAQSLFAVYQPFERGFMLYRADTGQITVFYTRTSDGSDPAGQPAIGGRAVVYADTYSEGQPDPADVPPARRFAPVRGFGVVWAALGGPVSGLGWALAPEAGYDALVQPTGRRSFTTYISLPAAAGGEAGPVLAFTHAPGQPEATWAQVTGTAPPR